MGSDEVWAVLDAEVAGGRVPGYAAAVRAGGRTEVRCGGRTAFDGPPVTGRTLFRIASLTEPIGAALALALVRDGVVALEDPIGRWLPELAAPRVLAHPAAELTDTVPAERDVTVRDLLAGTSGWGVVMAFDHFWSAAATA